MANIAPKGCDSRTKDEGPIILDGLFEVHPAADFRSWCVVNSDTGHVRYDLPSKVDAIAIATELNRIERRYRQ